MFVESTISNRFVIYKHVSFPEDRYTKLSKRIPQIINILHAYTARKKLITIVTPSPLTKINFKANIIRELTMEERQEKILYIQRTP